MSFQQALSGLNASSKSLDVTSNNVANASTVGFKSGSAHFGDVFASSLSGAGAAQIGIGTSIAAIQQSFTQGNITSTSNPLDIAINGGGFFRMETNGVATYSRNGQFHLDSSGYIIDDKSRQLTGYPAVNGVVVQSSPQPLQMDAADQTPVATGSGTGSFQGVRAVVNLDSRAASTTWVADTDATPFVGTTTAPNTWTPNPTDYNWSTAVSIYDTLGNAHTLSLYACKTATAGQWQIHANVDGVSDTGVTLSNATLRFTTSGQLDPAFANNGVVGVSVNLNGVMTALGGTNSAVSPLAFDVDFTGSSQYGSKFGANRLEQDGYTSGRLTGVSVTSDGVLRGNYSNGQSRDLGQVALANFTNPNGLASLGGNQWAETSVSGQAMVGAPGTSSLGVLQSAAVEESNVDLTGELVNMITQQRNYQANAQAIKTQDQIMQTMVNLR